LHEYILRDEQGRVLTDEEGIPRIWYNKKQAEKDAKFLSEKLNVKLKVVKGKWRWHWFKPNHAIKYPSSVRRV